MLDNIISNKLLRFNILQYAKFSDIIRLSVTNKQIHKYITYYWKYEINRFPHEYFDGCPPKIILTMEILCKKGSEKIIYN